MKIYLAGFKTIEKLYTKSTKDINLLSSFYEHKGGVYGNYVKQENHILDSGAFTFLNNSSKGNLDWDNYITEYAKFINKNNIQKFFNLDIESICGDKEEERLRRKLEALTNKKCIPVWHKARGLDYFKWLTKEYNYIAIGGIVTKEIKKTEYPVFTKLLKIAAANNCKFHGLGFTNIKGMHKYPFYSVDSTNWMASRFGSMGLYKFTGNDLKQIKKPPGMKKNGFKCDLFNFNEWIKFAKYAERHL